MVLNDRPQRELYARWLDMATKAGFVISLIAFLLYVARVLPPYVALEELPRYWNLPVDQFIRATGAPSGWAWLGELRYGDGLNLLAIALLGLVTPLCYARLVPALLAQLAVLLGAASGLVAG
jgi:xanthine/uracil permease